MEYPNKSKLNGNRIKINERISKSELNEMNEQYKYTWKS